MDFKLKNKKVLVAGSSQGIGLAIAQAFAKEGARLWITGRNANALQTARKKIKGSQSSLLDLSSENGVRELVLAVQDTWNSLDHLVLVLGGGKSSQPTLQEDESEWQRVFSQNLFSHALLIKHFKALLAKGKSPSIVSISSIAGQISLEAPPPYCAAKAALDHFCQRIAPDLAKEKIRYNTIAAGNIFVSGGRWEEIQKTRPRFVKELLQKKVPLSRFGAAGELATTTLFLSSPLSAFTTGSSFRLDGGQSVAF